MDTTPLSYLDHAVIRVALNDAKRLIAQGRSADEAAALACSGAWSPLRPHVHAQLAAAA